MIPKECKRLAEVDFPIAEVSRHAARGKSIPMAMETIERGSRRSGLPKVSNSRATEVLSA